MKTICYRAGYKYQLTARFSVDTGIKLPQTVATEFMRMLPTGHLIIQAGYAWDGPSGPTFDTKNFMRGSLVHDALYQLIRLGLLPVTCKPQADRLLQTLCLEDGMWKIRAWWVYLGVSKFGSLALDPAHEGPELTAP